MQHGLQLHQVDVITLNGQLKEEVFMKQPEGFIAKGQEHLVCRLDKSLFALKQSPRCWNTALDQHLREIGFVQIESDPSLHLSCIRRRAVLPCLHQRDCDGFEEPDTSRKSEEVTRLEVQHQG